MLVADISPVVGKVVEFDVPGYDELLEQYQKPGNPQVQRLVSEMPFNEMFAGGFIFGGGSDPIPDTVRLFRCVGHLHIAALGMWLEDAETGEMLCSGGVTYGDSPEDKGILTAIHVDSYEEPKVFPSDRVVRFVTEYNATELHTGVMGLYFLFIDRFNNVTAEDTDLDIEVCTNPTCDTSLLPNYTPEELAAMDASCKDTLAESPVCSFADLCDCEAFVNHEESTGCGGIFTTPFGDIEVDSMCGKYCDSCPHTTTDEVIQADYVERLERDLSDKCEFSTPECRHALNNAYSCHMGMPGIESYGEDVLRQATANHAGRLALKYSKLGSPSLHRGGGQEVEQEELVVRTCAEVEAGGSGSDGGASSSAAAPSPLSFASSRFSSAVLAVLALAFAVLA